MNIDHGWGYYEPRYTESSCRWCDEAQAGELEIQAQASRLVVEIETWLRSQS